MLTVIALEGNALLQRHDKPDATIQRHHIQRAATALAPLAGEGQVLLCHGNGLQIGILAMEGQDGPALTGAYSLDALGTQTQGMIGFWLAQELHNAGVSRPVVAVMTKTVVDQADPTFASPSKFIGRVYTRGDPEHLDTRHGWQICTDGPAWRRVVPSPQPLRILEQDSIHRLLDTGAVVICAGGCAAVTRDERGHFPGIEAVVDEDYTCARIALDLAADRLLLLTDCIKLLGYRLLAPTNGTSPEEMSAAKQDAAQEDAPQRPSPAQSTTTTKRAALHTGTARATPSTTTTTTAPTASRSRITTTTAPVPARRRQCD